jgi:hypothetical protein
MNFKIVSELVKHPLYTFSLLLGQRLVVMGRRPPLVTPLFLWLSIPNEINDHFHDNSS